SFTFVFVFFILGYRLLFRVRLLSINKALAYSFFFLIFFSVAIGFAHAFISDTPNYLEGNFGYWSNRLLDAQIGQSGTGGVLIFLALTVLVIAYNVDFKLPQRKERLVAVPEPVDVVPPSDINNKSDIEDEEHTLPLEWQGPGRTRKDVLE